jgi:hypothetical protein
VVLLYHFKLILSTIFACSVVLGAMPWPPGCG